MSTDNPKIHPDFALQLHGKLLTLKERFYWKLEDVTRELAENRFHAPNTVRMHVSAFISNVTQREHDCIAQGDVPQFNRYWNELDIALRPLRYLPDEPARNRPIENHNHAK